MSSVLSVVKRLRYGFLCSVVVATGCSSVPDRPAGADRVADYAMSTVGIPYHYGGSSPKTGFDCSGLVKWSYARVGIRLPHGTDHLRQYSKPVSLSNLRRGDLVFFTQLGKVSSHVGIYVGNDRFVHAPSTGKKIYVAKLTDNYWKKHFDEARRIIAD